VDAAPAARLRRRLTGWRHRAPRPLALWLEAVRWARAPWTPDPPLPPRLADREPRPRVLIAPANFAGQGWQWARALDRAGAPAVSWQRTAAEDFGYPADLREPISVNRASRRRQRTVLADVARTVDAVVVEAGRPLFGRLFRHDLVREVEALRGEGLKVATLWHGSDIRVSSRGRAPGDPAGAPDPDGRFDALDAVARRHRAELARIGGPTLVSTPDLLTAVPQATWCPVVVDADAWRAPEPPLRRRVPVVLHLPSNPTVKGTASVEPVLARLEAEGLIEALVPPRVPAGEVPALVAGVDVVLDQFRLGIYGVAACEAMAAGRLVVSMVDDQVRGEVRRATGRELPIVQAEPERLEAVLRAVVADRDPFGGTAAAGEAFVREVHDGRRSAAALLAALELTP
jgi:hypothetical protein